MIKTSMLQALVLTGLITACGSRNDTYITGNITDTIQFDTDTLLVYFKAKCATDHPRYTPAQVMDCANSQVADFLYVIASSGKSKHE